MSSISINRSHAAQLIIVWVLTLAAAAFLGLVLAYWTWAWLGPQPEPRALSSAGQYSQVKSAETLFGNTPQGAPSAVPTGIAISLLGIVAAEGGRSGFAIVRIDGKESLAVREGENIAPATRIAEVDKDHIILERNGVREILVWPKRKIPTPRVLSEPTGPTKPAEATEPTTPRHRIRD